MEENRLEVDPHPLGRMRSPYVVSVKSSQFHHAEDPTPTNSELKTSSSNESGDSDNSSGTASEDAEVRGDVSSMPSQSLYRKSTGSFKTTRSSMYSTGVTTEYDDSEVLMTPTKGRKNFVKKAFSPIKAFSRVASRRRSDRGEDENSCSSSAYSSGSNESNESDSDDEDDDDDNNETRDDEEVEEEPETPQEAADKLAGEIEAMGYNLQSCSFFTRSGSDLDKAKERYSAPLLNAKRYSQQEKLRLGMRVEDEDDDVTSSEKSNKSADDDGNSQNGESNENNKKLTKQPVPETIDEHRLLGSPEENNQVVFSFDANLSIAEKNGLNSDPEQTENEDAKQEVQEHGPIEILPEFRDVANGPKIAQQSPTKATGGYGGYELGAMNWMNPAAAAISPSPLKPQSPVKQVSVFLNKAPMAQSNKLNIPPPGRSAQHEAQRMGSPYQEKGNEVHRQTRPPRSNNNASKRNAPPKSQVQQQKAEHKLDNIRAPEVQTNEIEGPPEFEQQLLEPNRIPRPKAWRKMKGRVANTLKKDKTTQVQEKSEAQVSEKEEMNLAEKEKKNVDTSHPKTRSLKIIGTVKPETREETDLPKRRLGSILSKVFAHRQPENDVEDVHVSLTDIEVIETDEGVDIQLPVSLVPNDMGKEEPGTITILNDCSIQDTYDADNTFTLDGLDETIPESEAPAPNAAYQKRLQQTKQKKIPTMWDTFQQLVSGNEADTYKRRQKTHDHTNITERERQISPTANLLNLSNPYSYGGAGSDVSLDAAVESVPVFEKEKKKYPGDKGNLSYYFDKTTPGSQSASYYNGSYVKGSHTLDRDQTTLDQMTLLQESTLADTDTLMQAARDRSLEAESRLTQCQDSPHIYIVEKPISVEPEAADSTKPKAKSLLRMFSRKAASRPEPKIESTREQKQVTDVKDDKGQSSSPKKRTQQQQRSGRRKNAVSAASPKSDEAQTAPNDSEADELDYPVEYNDDNCTVHDSNQVESPKSKSTGMFGSRKERAVSMNKKMQSGITLDSALEPHEEDDRVAMRFRSVPTFTSEKQALARDVIMKLLSDDGGETWADPHDMMKGIDSLRSEDDSQDENQAMPFPHNVLSRDIDESPMISKQSQVAAGPHGQTIRGGDRILKGMKSDDTYASDLMSTRSLTLGEELFEAMNDYWRGKGGNKK